jgi:hypothetical protein
VFLYVTGDFWMYVPGSHRVRNYLLTVDDKTLFINVLSPTDRFDEVMAKAGKLIESIRFE